MIFDYFEQNGSLKILIGCVSEKKGLGRFSFPPITFDYLRGLELSISNQISLYQSLYDYPFRENLIYPRGITYNPRPRTMGGCVEPEGLVR